MRQSHDRKTSLSTIFYMGKWRCVCVKVASKRIAREQECGMDSLVSFGFSDYRRREYSIKMLIFYNGQRCTLDSRICFRAVSYIATKRKASKKKKKRKGLKGMVLTNDFTLVRVNPKTCPFMVIQR